MSSRGGPRQRGGDRGRGRGNSRGGDFKYGRGGGRGQRSRGRDGQGERGGGPSPNLGVFSLPSGTPQPSQEVTRLEDALQASINSLGSLGQLSLKDMFPIRPAYGTKGAPVTLWANYVEIKAASQLVLYRYDISISPDVAGRKAIQVIRLLLASPELASIQPGAVTDFRSTLISTKRLSEDDTRVTILYRAEDEDEPSEKATTYTVRMLYTNTLSMSELNKYLATSDASARYDDTPVLIQAFNIFLNYHSRSSRDLFAVGPHKIFSTASSAESWNLGGGITALRGFYASVRAATSRLLVNINVSHSAFYNQGPLEQLLFEFDYQHKPLIRLQSFIRLLRVRTTHLPARRNKKGVEILRVKTILGLATPNDGYGLPHPPKVSGFGADACTVQFWLDDRPSTTAIAGGKKKAAASAKKGKPAAPTGGKYISVFDFFKQAYDITLKSPGLPVVNVGTRQNPTYLPVEVCQVLPGQPFSLTMKPTQIQQMIRFAVRTPNDNAMSISRDGLTIAGLTSQNPLLKQYMLSVNPNLITVPGRVLTEPRIFYRQEKSVQTRSGSWNLINVKFATSGSLKRWSYLMVSLPDYRDPMNPEELGNVIRGLRQNLVSGGVNVEPPYPGRQVHLNGPEDSQLDAVMKSAAEKFDLLFIVLPDQHPIYGRIKHLGDVKYGIHTICSVGHKLAKSNRQEQYFANLSLKFNLKLGGNNQIVESSHLGLIQEDKTMVVGIDVTHPSPGASPIAPSVAGMVASVDRWLGQWPAVLKIQIKPRQEMVSDLKNMLKSRLTLWKTLGKHREFPENILIYRDGVSEGQYQKVLEEELPQLRAACAEMYPVQDQKKGLPRMCIVIVGKRHHTRFYPTQEANADRSANPKAGTVVDRGVTDARMWDFFLQGHAAIQGTARPGHYVVVLDEIFRSRYPRGNSPQGNLADTLQEITLALCWTYGRATKAVSLCTPAYYADIACDRARCYLRSLYDTPNQSAANSVMSMGSVPMDSVNDEVGLHPKLQNSMFYI